MFFNVIASFLEVTFSLAPVLSLRSS